MLRDSHLNISSLGENQNKIIQGYTMALLRTPKTVKKIGTFINAKLDVEIAKTKATKDIEVDIAMVVCEAKYERVLLDSIEDKLDTESEHSKEDIARISLELQRSTAIRMQARAERQA